jgi:hypothetical protein
MMSRPLALVIVFASLSASTSAFGWSDSTGTGTYGFGAIRVDEPGAFTFVYSRQEVEGTIVRGVQLTIVDYTTMFERDDRYLRLASEYFVASYLDDGLAIQADVELEPGIYLFVYGPWTGITHDSPFDRAFQMAIEGTGTFDIISEWAGDVSLFNEAEAEYPVRSEGVIGKISAIWDSRTLEELRVLEAFPNAKIVTRFGEVIE